MTNFLFWNTNRRPLIDEIGDLCAEYEIDVLILAEYVSSTVPLLLRLNSGVGRTYIEPLNPSQRLKFITRYPIQSLKLVSDEPGIAIRRIVPPVGTPVTMIALHLNSKLHMSAAEQAIQTTRLATAIRAAENHEGDSKSFIIGDLNMDPYEDGVVAADGIHGVMDKSVAAEIVRVVGGVERHYFYNPMWTLFGDEDGRPSGTYFRRGGQISPFWHMFDQVLLRPAVLPYYSANGLKIIRSAGARALFVNDRIDSDVSDHLPLYLKLELENGA